MFVAIDMDRLGFLHKHHDHETVSGLSWLECGQSTSIHIANIEADNFLKGITHSDVIRLYKNVTGLEPMEGNWGDRGFHFREHLREVARGLTVTTALAEEVAAQVAAVDDRLHAGERFKYALGARMPAQAADLFPMSARALNVAQIKAVNARADERVRAHKELLAREKSGVDLPASRAWDAPPTQSATPAAPEPDSAPVRKAKAATGSVRPVIRGRADAAWKDHGDKDWKTVKAELLTALEAEGYHPTTIRIKLNEWAKDQGIV